MGLKERGVIAERLVGQLPIEEDIQTGKIHLHHLPAGERVSPHEINPAEAGLLF